MANLNVTLSGSVQVVDNTSSNNQIIVNRPISFTLAAGVSFYDAFFNALSTGSSVNLPAATSFFAMVINKSTTTNLTVAFTPVGGSAGSVILTPGSCWIYCPVSEGSGGLTALTLTGASATVPCEVLVAA